MTVSILDNESPDTLPPYIMSNVLTKWALESWDRSYLEKYYILHWRTDYFIDKSNSSSLHHDGVEYLILYHRCLIAQIKESDSKEVALSFRKLKSFPYGYVLVKPL
jgi:hypothetical protein